MVLKQSPLSCNRQNSTKCDRCVLNLLRPYLETDESNLILNRFQPMLTQFKKALDQEGVISLASNGQIQFITQRAKHLLSQYFLSPDPHSLPDVLQNWLKHQTSQHTADGGGLSCCFPLRIERSGQQLTIHLIFDPVRQHYLLLLEEQKTQSFSVAALELLELTKREAEVLFWIAKDKSNSEIAKALGCCEGTVRKHLEHLYKKLGVQTRMGAVMVALEKLGLLQA